MRRALLVAALAVVAAALAFGFGGPAAVERRQRKLDRACREGRDQAREARRSSLPNGGTASRSLPFVSDSGLVIARAVALRPTTWMPNCDERTEAGRHRQRRPVGRHRRPRARLAHARLRAATVTRTGNTRVNQDCTYRRQAEEEIVYNPADPSNLVAGQNDSRVGFNQCGTDFSTNERQELGRRAAAVPLAAERPGRHGAERRTTRTATRSGAGRARSTPTTRAAIRRWPSTPEGARTSAASSFDVASNASGLYVTQSPRGRAGLVLLQRSVAAGEGLHGRRGQQRDSSSTTRTSSPRTSIRAARTGTTCTSPGRCSSSMPGRVSAVADLRLDVHRSWHHVVDAGGHQRSSDTLCFFGNAFDPTLSRAQVRLRPGIGSRRPARTATSR